MNPTLFLPTQGATDPTPYLPALSGAAVSAGRHARSEVNLTPFLEYAPALTRAATTPFLI